MWSCCFVPIDHHFLSGRTISARRMIIHAQRRFISTPLRTSSICCRRLKSLGAAGRSMASVSNSIPHIIRTAKDPRQHDLHRVIVSKVDEVNSSVRLVQLQFPNTGVSPSKFPHIVLLAFLHNYGFLARWLHYMFMIVPPLLWAPISSHCTVICSILDYECLANNSTIPSYHTYHHRPTVHIHPPPRPMARRPCPFHPPSRRLYHHIRPSTHLKSLQSQQHQ